MEFDGSEDAGYLFIFMRVAMLYVVFWNCNILKDEPSCRYELLWNVTCNIFFFLFLVSI